MDDDPKRFDICACGYRRQHAAPNRTAPTWTTLGFNDSSWLILRSLPTPPKKNNNKNNQKQNPWINYPYETNVLMKAAASACHALGLKFKIYNTMRELSNRCREVFAMRSLNETYVVGTSPSHVIGSALVFFPNTLRLTVA